MRNDYLTLYSGVDIVLKETNVIMHQPTIKEIAMLGEDNLFILLQLINLDKDSVFGDETKANEVSNLDIFLRLINVERQDLREVAAQFFTLLFKDYKVEFLEKEIKLTFNEQEDVVVSINKDSYEEVKKTINDIFMIHSIDENASKDKATQKLVAKFKKRKEILTKKKQNLQTDEEKMGEIPSAIASMVSVLSIGNNISTQEILNYNYLRLCVDYKKLVTKVQYDSVDRYRIAGAKIEHDPDNWI